MSFTWQREEPLPEGAEDLGLGGLWYRDAERWRGTVVAHHVDEGGSTHLIIRGTHQRAHDVLVDAPGAGESSDYYERVLAE